MAGLKPVTRHLARKRFGQHFLTDVHIIGAIVDAIAPVQGDALVEVGPGLGAMTLPLLRCIKPFSVIELDRDLAARLRQNADLDVIESDVLRVDFAALATAKGQKLRVVGNLPYNISTPILFHLLTFVEHVVDQHFMLQKEVVDRMAAAPGCKDYGRLTVMLQWRYAIEAVFDVPPESFDPPPRVNSAIVRMQPYAQPPVIDVVLFGALVQAAFSQRRKLLRHSLGVWLTTRGFKGDFNLQRRAEEVPLAEYVALAQQVSASSTAGA